VIWTSEDISQTVREAGEHGQTAAQAVGLPKCN
jgi:hypothetical protein